MSLAILSLCVRRIFSVLNENERMMKFISDYLDHILSVKY